MSDKQTFTEFALQSALALEPNLSHAAAKAVADAAIEISKLSYHADDVLDDRPYHNIVRETIQKKLAELREGQPGLFVLKPTLEEAALSLARQSGHQVDTLSDLEPGKRITFAREVKASGIELRDNAAQPQDDDIKVPQHVPANGSDGRSTRRNGRAANNAAMKTVTNADIAEHCGMAIEKIGPNRRITVARQLAAEKLRNA